VPSQESELSGVSIDLLPVTFLLIIPYLKITAMKVEILTDYLYLLTTDIKYKLSVKISTFIEIIYLKRCSEMK
jgi:hypothetical protein